MECASGRGKGRDREGGEGLVCHLAFAQSICLMRILKGKLTIYT